tara:strand:- start:744 stop:1784 length:1041 start_codon:yes stop_codon:yes gene_type:complete
MKPLIGIIIPCYKANKFINNVIERIVKSTSLITEYAFIKIYLIDDNCPYNSWKEVDKKFDLNIIKHSKNFGVGKASITGFKAAKKDNCDFFIKIDADGQHAPEYLSEIILFLLTIQKHELFILKGSRYHFYEKNIKIPLTRKIGSVLLEPMARMALNYRGLSDIANGFIATNSISLEYLLSNNIGTKLSFRYLFESSILEKVCMFQCKIFQFPMAANYSKDWQSSMKSRVMILPILNFWLRAILRRIKNNYFLSLNLGSLLLILLFTSILYTLNIYFKNIAPNIAAQVFVSAGISTLFTSMITISIMLLLLFFFYDYTSGNKVKTVNFNFYLKDVESHYKYKKNKN